MMIEFVLIITIVSMFLGITISLWCILFMVVDGIFDFKISQKIERWLDK